MKEVQASDRSGRSCFPWVAESRSGRTQGDPALGGEAAGGGRVDLENASALGIRSNLTLPLTVGGESPIGALALNTVQTPRDWPDALVRRLELVAQVFTNALARRRHELDLRESRERLELAADSAEAGLWTLDFATGGFWATARAREILGYSPDEPLDLGRYEASVLPEDWRAFGKPSIEPGAPASPSASSTGSVTRARAACAGSLRAVAPTARPAANPNA